MGLVLERLDSIDRHLVELIGMKAEQMRQEYGDGGRESGEGPVQSESLQEAVSSVKSGRPAAAYPAIVPCVVLDPFAGSGTVGQVARNLSRSSILIEIKEEYVQLMKERVDYAPKPPEQI